MNNRQPATIFKYRNWDDENHQRMLLHNEIFLAPPSYFNDPFDCGITQSFCDLSDDEKECYIVDAGKQMFLQYSNIPGFNLEKQLKELEARFQDITELQLYYDKLHYEMQNDHLGVFSCSSRWNSILMWSHYSNSHKGFCVGFNRVPLMKYFAKIGNVVYKSKYPIFKPKILQYDEEFIMKSFMETHTKALHWKYENEYRLMKTIFPENYTEITRRVMVDDSCFKEVILGINSSEETRHKLIEICTKKRIPIYLTKKKMYTFEMEKFRIN